MRRREASLPPCPALPAARSVRARRSRAWQRTPPGATRHHWPIAAPAADHASVARPSIEDVDGMIFQLRHRGLFVADEATLERARAEFECRNCLHVPNLLEPQLARVMVAALERGNFADYSHEGIGTELVAKPGLATGVLELLANDPQLFEAVRTVTGCGPIGCFHGRVYRMVPGSGHYDSWHSD